MDNPQPSSYVSYGIGRRFRDLTGVGWEGTHMIHGKEMAVIQAQLVIQLPDESDPQLPRLGILPDSYK